jgi:GntR family transcriptional repressor for pyruvate dehydrogenase complex
MGVADAAVEKIHGLILAGRLSPGDRLPPEQELAAELGVSRSSLREAVSALSQARVLDVRRGDGTYVTSLEPNVLLSGLSFVMDLMRGGTLLEIFEVRRLLEPAATALAAARITDDQIGELRLLMDKLRDAADPEDRLSVDMAFHGRIAGITGNQTLCSLLDAVFHRGLAARVWRACVERDRMDWAMEQHEQIVLALEMRDPDTARAASTLHLVDSERWLREVVHAEVASGVELGAIAASFVDIGRRVPEPGADRR